jgi:hypothetical protein
MAEAAWLKLDRLISMMFAAVKREGAHQQGYQQWDDKKSWEEIDEYNRAETLRWEAEIREFISQHTTADLKPRWGARRSLSCGWPVYRESLRRYGPPRV